MAEKKDIVLVGGGHAHVQVIKALNGVARPNNVSVTLIDPQQSAIYSGMMPGCVSKLYTEDETRIHLVPLAKWADIRFINSSVVALDRERRVLTCSDGQEVHYDAVSFDIGSATKGTDTVPGVRDFAIATRPISELPEKIQTKQTQLLSSGKRDVRVVVVGGGAAGVELAFGLKARWAPEFDNVNITLLNKAPELTAPSALARTVLMKVLEEKNIRLMNSQSVKSVLVDRVVTDDGSELECDAVLWATGAEAHSVSTHLGGLETTEDGYLVVQRTLQSPSDPRVFAAGDCAHITGLPNGPPPKAGVYAVRAGPILTTNLLAMVADQQPQQQQQGAALQEYLPQADFLRLIMTGDGAAIGLKFGLVLRGEWVWGLKDHIDRGFMRLFQESLLPDLSAETRPSSGGVRVGQYDAEFARATQLSAAEGASILADTTRPASDFQPANQVLKRMNTDAEYCAAVVEAFLAAV